MNTLPEEILDTIYKYKHQMQFRVVVKDLDRMGQYTYCCVVYPKIFLKRDSAIASYVRKMFKEQEDITTASAYDSDNDYYILRYRFR